MGEREKETGNQPKKVVGCFTLREGRRDGNEWRFGKKLRRFNLLSKLEDRSVWGTKKARAGLGIMRGEVCI